MLNKKKIFILVGSVTIVIAIGILIFILVKNNRIKSANISLEGTINVVPPPEFMSDAEKTNLNLPADSKIQILKTDESGKTEVYRIIRKDADLVLDPSRVGEPGMVQSGY